MSDDMEESKERGARQKRSRIVSLAQDVADNQDTHRDLMLWAIWQTLEDINEALRAKTGLVPNE
jgi:hypothetical protein